MRRRVFHEKECHGEKEGGGGSDKGRGVGGRCTTINESIVNM